MDRYLPQLGQILNNTEFSSRTGKTVDSTHYKITVVPRDTNAFTYKIFEILAVDREIFCFEIRETLEIRGIGSAVRPAARNRLQEICYKKEEAISTSEIKEKVVM